MGDQRIKLHRPGSSAYSRALDIFNGSVQAEPSAVLVPTDVYQLADAVAEANTRGLTVSIRGGGHGISGRAVKGDWVIDMRELNNCRFEGSIVLAESGLTWGMLDKFTASRGMAVPGGTVSTTGIAGLTLGGGIGWLLPQAGLTCDNLLAVRGVTGDGRIVQVDDKSDPDLMALLRGHGHGLLAVSEFEYETVSIPEYVSAGSISYDLDYAGAVINSLMTLSDDCPEEIAWSPALTVQDGVKVLSIDGVAFGGVDFAAWCREACVAPASDVSVTEMLYPEAQRMLDNPRRWGQRSSWRSVFTTSINEEAVEYLIRRFREAPHSGCQVFIERMAGVDTVPHRPSTFPLRWAKFDVLVTASWDSSEEDAAYFSWLDSTKAGLCSRIGRSTSAGTYLNYADRAENAAKAEQFSEADLCVVMDRCDPNRTFQPATKF